MMNLLFDLDGTLTDPFPGITTCISYALKQLDRQPPPREALRWCIGPPLKASFKKLLATDRDELADAALGHYRERFSSVGLFENRVYAGIPEVLDELRGQGVNLYLATSKPRVFAQRILVHFRLDHYFRNVYGSELDGTRSEKADLIAHILEREGIAATQAAMIGDRKYDMIGANKNGMSAYGVLWGYGSKAELETAGAKGCVTVPDDLPTLINGYGRIGLLRPSDR